MINQGFIKTEPVFAKPLILKDLRLNFASAAYENPKKFRPLKSNTYSLRGPRETLGSTPTHPALAVPPRTVQKQAHDSK